jgi:hypothetical protein
MNITVTITSTDSTAVTYNQNAITSVKNADGTTSHTHQCQIIPKSGVNDCSYIIDVSNGVKWAWTLVNWNYA